jgi:hypothetical protein
MRLLCESSGLYLSSQGIAQLLSSRHAERRPRPDQEEPTALLDADWISGWLDREAVVRTATLSCMIADAGDSRPGAKARLWAQLNLVGLEQDDEISYWKGVLAAAQASLKGSMEQTLIRERAMLAWSRSLARIHFVDGFLDAVRWMEVKPCA